MICQNCLDGGAENSIGQYKRATKFHKKCDFKGCVCQHKTGQGWVKVKGVPVPLMQTQSP
jgi:hypothetical protein